MQQEQVRIVKLEPMRVASFWAYSPSPEVEAWKKLMAWAEPQGLLDDPERHPLFGFNNPNPSPGSPKYGYEAWIVVDADTEPEGEARLVDFEGGLYAVMRCEVLKGQFEMIGATWKKLVAWREDSRYKYASHQWLEKNLPIDLPYTEFVLDLYLPIAE